MASRKDKKPTEVEETKIEHGVDKIKREERGKGGEETTTKDTYAR